MQQLKIQNKNSSTRSEETSFHLISKDQNAKIISKQTGQSEKKLFGLILFPCIKSFILFSETPLLSSEYGGA